MDGAASDLRTGLPWQMVEIHEPVRLLFIIETTPEAMLQIMDRNAGDRPAVRNGWVPAGRARSQTRRINVYRERRLPALSAQATDLPQAASSRRLVSRLARPPGVRRDRACRLELPQPGAQRDDDRPRVADHTLGLIVVVAAAVAAVVLGLSLAPRVGR